MEFEVLGIDRELCVWKGESKGLADCEDFAGGIPEAGLFAVADGAGTTSFSGLWAQCLVERFLSEPLLSPNGFEVERWLLPARAVFEQRLPDLHTLPRTLRDDLCYRGAAATLVGAQFRHGIGEPHGPAVAACFVITMGDSCAFHYSEDGRIIGSHSKQSEKEFDASPICFPSKGYDAAWWRAAEEREFSVREGDFIVLATDAVSRWLLVGDESVRKERFNLLLGQTNESWPHFIRSLRRRGLIRDDDSTAVTVRATNLTKPMPASAEMDARISHDRSERLRSALRTKDLTEIALEYGSGDYFENRTVVTRSGRTMPLASLPLLRTSQRTVEARRTLLECLGRYMERGKRNREEVQRAWNEFSDILATAAFAEGARKTLRAEGFDLGVKSAMLPRPTSHASEDESSAGRSSEPGAHLTLPSLPRRRNDNARVAQSSDSPGPESDTLPANRIRQVDREDGGAPQDVAMPNARAGGGDSASPDDSGTKAAKDATT